MGLMQLMPATARMFGGIRRKADLYKPEANVRVGTRYFSYLIERYSGDVELALAAYNAGPSRVDEWLKRYPVGSRMLFLDMIPFRETREYVASIARNYYWYKLLYAGSAQSAEASAKDLSKVFRLFSQ
jgi:soluble lytic murein transglycosylase